MLKMFYFFKYIRNTNITLLQFNVCHIDQFLILSYIFHFSHWPGYLTVLEYLGMPEGEEVARGVEMLECFLTPILM